MKTDDLEKLSISVVVLKTVFGLWPGLGFNGKAAKGKAAFIVMMHICTCMVSDKNLIRCFWCAVHVSILTTHFVLVLTPSV